MTPLHALQFLVLEQPHTGILGGFGQRSPGRVVKALVTDAIPCLVFPKLCSALLQGTVA